MCNHFSDDDSFEEKRIELEKKKQKKLEKQLRLKQKAELIQEMQKIREHKTNCPHDFNQCLENSNKYQRGTLKWALEFLSAQSDTDNNILRRIYLERAQLWHPDKNSDSNNLAMQYLNEAWQIVKKINKDL